MATTTVQMLVVLVVLCQVSLGHEISRESLVLNTFNSGQLYAVFNFSTVTNNSHMFENHHYNLFPRSLGELILKYNVAEFHLSMTQGLWRYKTWGKPYYPAPPGAELWVWFNPDSRNVDELWKGFTNALSGLLCASLNFIGKTETVSPAISFRPEGAVLVDSNILLKYAILPRENLCTENLTPWLKLLPCGSNSGISGLLDPAKLHHSQYLSLALNFKHSCEDGSKCLNPSLNLHQSVSTVFDLRMTAGRKPDFNVATTLNRKMQKSCPLSSSSEIKLHIPSGFSVDPNPDYVDERYMVYDLTKKNIQPNIFVTSNTTSDQDLAWEGPPLIAHCHLAGYLQQDGGIHCRLTNTNEKNVSVIVMQTVPWFLQIYLHTLEIKDQTGANIKKSHFTYHPAKIRNSPHFMEFVLNIPKVSTVEICIRFSRGFLTWTEHPPDANHGFYIPSTVVTVRDSSTQFNDDRVYRIYTENVQVHIPVPDFSMPYNVICLACTVIAIAFGSLHNLTTRTFQVVDPDASKKNIIQRIIAIPLQLFGWARKESKSQQQRDGSTTNS